MEAAPALVTPTSLPTGVFLIISMFLVSLAFRDAKKKNTAEALSGIKKIFRLALLHVGVGTGLNLALTWLTARGVDPSPEGQARMTAFLIASGLNALFPSLLGLGGVWFIFTRRQKAGD